MNEELAGLFSGENGAYVEALYEDYVLGRERVPESWRRLFDALHGGATPPAEPRSRTAPRERAATRSRRHRSCPAVPAVGIIGLIDAYRSHGHLVAKLDPLGQNRDAHPLLEPREFGLGDEHMKRRVDVRQLPGRSAEGTVPELIASLRRTYSGTLRARSSWRSATRCAATGCSRTWSRTRTGPSSPPKSGCAC